MNSAEPTQRRRLLIGKNTFHLIGLDERGAIVLRQKWSRGQLGARLANATVAAKFSRLVNFPR